MPHWHITYIPQGECLPLPSATKATAVVCAPTRNEARDRVPASPRYPVEVKFTSRSVTPGQVCTCSRVLRKQ